MATLTEFKVMMLSPRIKSTAELFQKLVKGSDGTNGLGVAVRAYATEMSLMTGLPEYLFQVRMEPICVAFTEDCRVLGFIQIGVDDGAKVICTEHSYVRPEVRHKGVYTLMMKRVEKLVKDMKFERIVSFVFNENELSQEVHEKQGFKKSMIGYIKEIK